MPVTDDQLEVLEAYIDGELPADEEDTLRRRLEAEPELASTLAALRSEREVRAMLWKACEPDDTTVQRLVMRIEAEVDREVVWAHRYAKWRLPSAAAACILFGVFIGWVGRGTPPVTADPGSSAMGSGVAVSTNTNPGGSLVTKIAPNLPTNMPPAGLTNVAVSNPVDVPLVDEYGRSLGVQHFKSAEDAARFIQDVSNWQNTQEKAKSVNIVPTGAEKF